MSYLKEFQAQIRLRNFSKILLLWEEWCASDSVDVEEFAEILKALKESEFSNVFSPYTEAALPLWENLSSQEDAYQILKLLVDLASKETVKLAALAQETLQKKYGKQPKFLERLRIIGFRNKPINVQGALSNYDLLNHLEEGEFVLHTSGWGTGQIVEVSHLREQATIEFENVPGKRQFTFSNAFNNLVPLSKQHFLARRFANYEKLEEEAKKNPVQVIKSLLGDLGPKTASEIKDLMCEWIIPENEWSKWWQATRTKLKKDPLISSPESIKDPFSLRKKELSHQDRLNTVMHNDTEIQTAIQTSYNFARDLPKLNKHPEVAQQLKEKVLSLLKEPEISKAQQLQVLFILDQFFNETPEGLSIVEMIKTSETLIEDVKAIEIVSFKKRMLSLIREHRADWILLFISLIYTLKHAQLRDYLLKELLASKEGQAAFIEELKVLLKHPENHPETFFWYFQQLASKDSSLLPFGNKEGKCVFLESFLILYSFIEHKALYKDLVKKMYLLLSGKRYEVIRSFIEGTSLDFIKEFLLLTSKCQTLSDHDLTILRSLAEVVHPSLNRQKENKNSSTIWTTEKGFLKIQDRLKEISTVEMIENAKEIEAARALGDLRENSEFKFAQERRARLQSEMKTLSEGLQKSRIITEQDIDASLVGIGTVVELQDSSGQTVEYTILGPWDADIDFGILSFQSKLAQAMLGLKEGDRFSFREDEFKIIQIKSYLRKS